MLKATSFLVGRGTTCARISRQCSNYWGITTKRTGLRKASSLIGQSKERFSRLGVATGTALLALGLSSPFYALWTRSDDAQTSQVQLGTSKSNKELEETTLRDLIRRYAVYTMCSIPMLVDNSPKLLELVNLPGLKWIADAFVRVTFFDQFVGGDTAKEMVPLLKKLRSANKGALLAYSVEVTEAEATTASVSERSDNGLLSHIDFVDEMIQCIDVAADFEDSLADKLSGNQRRTWVALKITALLPDAQALIMLSSHILSNRPASHSRIAFPGSPHSTDLDILSQPVKGSSTLTPEDIKSLRELQSELVRICTHAQRRGVKIIIDAEYSWYQPAVDALTLSLMRHFNKLPSQNSTDMSQIQPLVYGTYQAYLRRTPEHIAQALADAKANNYALGIKLVRGAYHPHELAAHQTRGNSLSISPDAEPPVWGTKAETDACFDKCAALLVRAVKQDVVDSSSARGHITPSSFAIHLIGRRTTRPSPSLGVMFATHNWDSCELILNELVQSGSACRRSEERGDVVEIGDDVVERVTIGQLYGMCDDLTDYLTNKTKSSKPFIIKYVPYGALSQVMPYLSRRAIENKSVLGAGGATRERRRASTEIRRRLFGS